MIVATLPDPTVLPPSRLANQVTIYSHIITTMKIKNSATSIQHDSHLLIYTIITIKKYFTDFISSISNLSLYSAIFQAGFYRSFIIIKFVRRIPCRSTCCSLTTSYPLFSKKGFAVIEA